VQPTPRLAAIVFAVCVVCAGRASATEFDCVIQPRQVLEIRSPVEGLVERVMVDRGDLVRKGQELAFIDTSVERVLAEGAKFRSEMEGALRAGQTRLQLGERRLARAQELAGQQFLPQQARDDALGEKQLAEADLLEARENRKLAEIELRRQQALIRLKTIRSPINGVVMERILQAGKLAESGVGRKPIFRIADIEALYVEALLPAEAYRQVKLGMVGQVVPAIPDARTERATVKVIDRVLDAGSGTFGVRLELPNKQARLLAGLRCRLSLPAVRLAGAPERNLEPVRATPPERTAPAPRPKATSSP